MITVQELKTWMDSNIEIQLVDVRETDELSICNIGGENIPMSKLAHQPQLLRKDVPVVLHCKSGTRSGKLAIYMEQTHKLKNLHSLEGGIIAWAEHIDPSLSTY